MHGKEDAFVPVFRESANTEPFFDDNDDKPAALTKQLEELERREALVKEMLEDLETAFEVLSQRNDALNKKEETLNREYLKLLEIESLYQGTDRLAESLGAVLPSFSEGERNSAKNQKKEDDVKVKVNTEE